MRTEQEIQAKIAEWKKASKEMESIVGASIAATAIGTLEWVLKSDSMAKTGEK